VFHCSRPNDMQVMGVRLRHIKTIIRDQFFALTLPLFVVKKVTTCTQKSTPPFHGKQSSVNLNFMHLFVCRLQSF